MLQKLLKPRFDEIVTTPIVVKLATVVPSPAIVTLLSLLTGLLSAFSLLEGYRSLAVLSLWLSGVFDMLDGAIAREQKKTSFGGAALDLLSDRLVECALILSLFALAPTDRAISSLLMMSALFISTSCSLAIKIHSPKKISYGVIERLELFLFFSAMIMLPSHFSTLASLFTILVTLTAFSKLFQLMMKDESSGN